MEFIVFDTEDDSRELMSSGKSGFDKRVTQIAAMASDGSKFYNTGNVGEFLSWLRNRKEKRIFAHNVQYDLGNLFGKNLDVLNVTMVGGRLIKADWGGQLFVDSFNLWPMSAKELGKAFGKKKLEFDSMSKEYVFRDVEIIFDAVSMTVDFCKEMGVDHIPTTLGGLCVATWKAMGGINCHDSNELSKKAYYGGRVELFKAHDESGKVAYTDINSLYPSCMLNEFPGPMEDTGTDLARFGIADVTIKLPKTDIGVLPWRDKEGRIVYGYGKIRGVWTALEIRAAVERGAIIEAVHEAIGTDDGFRCYSEFVRTCYDKRLNAESKAEKLMFKLLLNNLYGRLGTGGVIGRSVFRTEKTEEEGTPYGEKVMVELQMPLAKETNWAHAAYVTSYGRLALLQYLEKVGTEKLIYCDTDSVIFDCEEGFLPFETGMELGKMKIEKTDTGEDFWPGCETWAPKMYRAGEVWKAKGVPKQLAKEFILNGRASFDLPFKFREAVRFYDRGNRRQLSVWRTVEKTVSSNYDRKNFSNNRFFPCDLTNWE